MSYAVSMLSVHTSPLALPGSVKDAGGMNVYIRELARELGHSQLSVDIFTRRTHPDQPKIVPLFPHVRVIHIEAGPAKNIHKNEIYQYLPTFTRLVEDFAIHEDRTYDLLHSHYWLSGIVAQQLGRDWHVPHIAMFHTLAHLKQLAHPSEPELPLRLEQERLLIQQADRIIATTSDERTYMLRHCGALSSQVDVIPCGVNLSRFVPHNRQEARLRLGLNREKPLLLFVGRLDPFKGSDVLLQAVALMQQQAEVVIVGGNGEQDPDVEQLKRLARKLGIYPRVHFLHARPQEELPLIYSAADVTVVPSYHESFSLAAVESLACGTPVVATRAGGLMTIIRQDETGYLVPRVPGFFAERLDNLFCSPTILENMRAAARCSVLQYSWQSVADRVSMVYEDTLNDLEETEQLVAR
jgi:D-inositol-3-phosphate glycosyltransferase